MRRMFQWVSPTKKRRRGGVQPLIPETFLSEAMIVPGYSCEQCRSQTPTLCVDCSQNIVDNLMPSSAISFSVQPEPTVEEQRVSMHTT